jgi:hypothetical protein
LEALIFSGATDEEVCRRCFAPVMSRPVQAQQACGATARSAPARPFGRGLSFYRGGILPGRRMTAR